MKESITKNKANQFIFLGLIELIFIFLLVIK